MLTELEEIYSSWRSRLAGLRPEEQARFIAQQYCEQNGLDFEEARRSPSPGWARQLHCQLENLSALYGPQTQSRAFKISPGAVKSRITYAKSGVRVQRS
jgi:hypothetical protein